MGNPSRQCLEKCLANLESGKYSICFASGVAALNSLMSLLRAGDHILCGDILYGGSTQLITNITVRAGIETNFVDVTDLLSVEAALKPNTKVIMVFVKFIFSKNILNFLFCF